MVQYGMSNRNMTQAARNLSRKPEGKISENLQQASVPVVPWLSCQLSYGKMRRITRRMLCAGGRGTDSCSGDSGGPLTWNDVQVGITSFGAGCGVVPGVYTKISVMQQWIKDTVESNHKEKNIKKEKKNKKRLLKRAQK